MFLKTAMFTKLGSFERIDDMLGEKMEEGIRWLVILKESRQDPRQCSVTVEYCG